MNTRIKRIKEGLRKHRVKRVVKKCRRQQVAQIAWCNRLGFPAGLREIEEREYLTKDGFKQWGDLTLADMMSLGIRI